MTSPDPHLIARQLSEAQKKALLWLPKTHDPRLATTWRGDAPRHDVLMRLRALGLAFLWRSEDFRPAAWSLSIDGYPVRAALARLAEEKSNGG